MRDYISEFVHLSTSLRRLLKSGRFFKPPESVGGVLYNDTVSCESYLAFVVGG